MGVVGRLLGIGTAGAAGYGAANVQTQANSINGVLEGVSEAGQNAAEGLGALLGSARTGFTSASRAPQPTITHVYHDSRSQSGGTVTVVVVSSSALAAYATLCWWKGWDFFGVSNARLHAALAQVRQASADYYQKAQAEFSNLKNMLDVTTKEQARQADVLHEVNTAVRQSGAQLEEIGMQNEDIAAVLQRAQLSNEAAGRSMIAIQIFLASFAAGNVHDKEEAMRMLESAVKQQAAALPSTQSAMPQVQEIEDGDNAAPAQPQQRPSLLQRGARLLSAPVVFAQRFVQASCDLPDDAAATGSNGASQSMQHKDEQGAVLHDDERARAARWEHKSDSAFEEAHERAEAHAEHGGWNKPATFSPQARRTSSALHSRGSRRVTDGSIAAPAQPSFAGRTASLAMSQSLAAGHDDEGTHGNGATLGRAHSGGRFF